MPAVAAAAAAPKAEEKPKKKRAAKASKETVVAEAAVAILEQVKEAPKEVEALTETLGQLALEEQPKAKKAKKAPEPTVGSNAGAGVEPIAAKKKPGPKPKAKVEGDINLEKLTPTHKKHIKTIAAELKVEANEKEFVIYANGMPAEEWGAKSLNDHIRDFLRPEGAPAPVPKEFLTVEFKGKEYLVDPATKFVYAMTDEENVKSRDHIGDVGLLEFKEMEI
jgi:hypothetical protein